MSAPGEWIEWKGGECPIAPGVQHFRRYRDGSEEGVFRQVTGIQRSVWLHNGDDDDIIAYRVVNP